jgi:tetratricopeptide (TPR) repeat protein
MSCRNALSSLLLVLIAALPAAAQRPSAPVPNRAIYSISGNVRDDSSQQTMENVRVDLYGNAGVPLMSYYTRSNGEFQFDGLPNGSYSIGVDLKGYDPYRESVAVQGGSRVGIPVFLRKPTTLPAPAKGGLVSAHLLKVPRKASEEFEKGRNLLYVKMDYRGAIKQFDQAVMDFPDLYEAYAEEGSAYIYLHDAKSGEAVLRKSIELSDSHYAQPILLLAGLMNDDGRYADAEPLARQGLGLDATSPRGYVELARALVGLKKPDEAEKNAAQARQMKPDDASVYLIMANVHIQQGNAAALLHDLESYLTLMPTGPEADQARKTSDQLRTALQKQQDQQKVQSQ